MTRKIAQIGIIAALYAVLTISLAPLSYGNIQFRFSEVLTLMAFFNPIFIPGLTIGTLIANLFSPLGIVDIVFGTVATFISVFLISKTKNFILSSIWPVIINGLIIGAELYFVFKLPLLLSILEVAIGEFVVVSIVGVIVFKSSIMNTKWFEKLVK
ncbi:MAG: QueT transporter family protein [Clostridiales bacterium]|nr:QueT transporter family protein [Clostridiales bacterium]